MPIYNSYKLISKENEQIFSSRAEICSFLNISIPTLHNIINKKTKSEYEIITISNKTKISSAEYQTEYQKNRNKLLRENKNKILLEENLQKFKEQMIS